MPVTFPPAKLRELEFPDYWPQATRDAVMAKISALPDAETFVSEQTLKPWVAYATYEAGEWIETLIRDADPVNIERDAAKARLLAYAGQLIAKRYKPWQMAEMLASVQALQAAIGSGTVLDMKSGLNSEAWLRLREMVDFHVAVRGKVERYMLEIDKTDDVVNLGALDPAALAWSD